MTTPSDNPDAHNRRGFDDPALERYSKQMLYEPIGVEGQRRLTASRAVLIGCGAIGSVQTDTLVRAGIGHLRLCDRDFVDRDNLQRQVLFDEDDITAALPKAEAAAAKLARTNSQVTVEPRVVDVTPDNIERLADGADILLDGTDNFETRFLINDLAVKTRRPWIYGAVIGTTGLCMTIVPHKTPCLRCVFEHAPPPQMSPTCDTVGVLAPVVHMVAGFQSLEAIKILSGCGDQINRHLLSIDAWQGRVTNLNIQSARDRGDCPCCKRGEFAHLDGSQGSTTTRLCGRDAVQVSLGLETRVDLEAIATRLEPIAREPIRTSRFMLKACVEEYELTLFPDGRAIIKGVTDADQARTLYAKYFGA